MHLILDTILPAVLGFITGTGDGISSGATEIVLAFFDPLIEFFSGSLKTKLTLSEQIVKIMLPRGEGLELQCVENMSACIADVLVLRTLSEILCTVLQDANEAGCKSDSVIAASVVEQMLV